MSAATTEQTMRELTDRECWDVLRREKFGRLAYHLNDEVNIVPINHGVRDGEIVFETSAGTKLAALDESPTVAYEVDVIDGDSATSVVVRGFVIEVDPENASRDDTGYEPWIDSVKVKCLSIVPMSVTGRWYRLSRG